LELVVDRARLGLQPSSRDRGRSDAGLDVPRSARRCRIGRRDVLEYLGDLAIDWIRVSPGEQLVQNDAQRAGVEPVGQRGRQRDADMQYPLHKAEVALETVRNEIYTAATKFPPFNSAHEGAAVIKEEFDELWEAVKGKQLSKQDQYGEAVQVAAMAVRFMLDCGPDE
ncbi:hypothetical protein LCGC14_3111130, partial [marine sediment metagenome]